MYMLDLVCFEEPFRFTLAAMRRFVQQRGALVVVAESQGQLVGFVVVHLIRRKTGYIVTLDVAAEFRRRGIATALVSAAERLVHDHAATEMALHVSTANASALAFYRREGYEGEGLCPNFYSAGLDALIYRKTLR